jgi:hypothetical protein
MSEVGSLIGVGGACVSFLSAGMAGLSGRAFSLSPAIFVLDSMLAMITCYTSSSFQ